MGGKEGNGATFAKFTVKLKRKVANDSLHVNLPENMNICHSQDKFNMQRNIHTRMLKAAKIHSVIRTMLKPNTNQCRKNDLKEMFPKC